MVLPIILLVTGIAFCGLIIYYWRCWERIPVAQLSQPKVPVAVSVIVPARNEAGTISTLLDALLQQDYPASLLEIIVIDDHSTDETAAIVRRYSRVKLIQLTAENGTAFKKLAIKTGIEQAMGTVIIATDADCQPGPHWVASLIAFREATGAVFIAAPVVIEYQQRLVQVFQAMDFMVLQGITGAVVHNRKMSMCNGANLAYDRAAFHAVNGFEGIDHIASGDDMLLMYKIEKQFPSGTQYLKSPEAIVTTAPMRSWRSFLNQRIRWASKAGNYQDKRILPVLLLVYLFNCCLLAVTIVSFFIPGYWLYPTIAWGVKLLVELPFFISLARFFKRPRLIGWFPFLQPLHVIYTIVSGLFGQFGTYEWKGRKVK